MGNRDLYRLHDDGMGMTDGLGSDLDHAIANAGQGPVGDGGRQNQGAQEGGQVIGQGVKLQPNRVGLETLARQACPFERLLAFFDGLLSRSAQIVELEHPFI